MLWPKKIHKWFRFLPRQFTYIMKSKEVANHIKIIFRGWVSSSINSHMWITMDLVSLKGFRCYMWQTTCIVLWFPKCHSHCFKSHVPWENGELRDWLPLCTRKDPKECLQVVAYIHSRVGCIFSDKGASSIKIQSVCVQAWDDRYLSWSSLWEGVKCQHNKLSKSP